ncbi:MAG: bacillithiol biosynthesis deacetylase BshB1 [Cytophagaceae bacterium]|jgi:bacillithiol biosynthesis deacetylase BshB1|nr:bacillithiol biosynthesis deacetylase BshB1 [Cytophagaceae bacterium]
MSSTIDVLVFAAHPDDAELACSGTIAKLVRQGKRVALVDLTLGELGTRGTPEIRLQEASASATILGLSSRHNAQFKDGYFEIDASHIQTVISYIRFFQPDIILANAPEDRHPDHGRAAQLIQRAHFMSGLTKIETSWEGLTQQAHRARKLYHYIQDRWLTPSFIVDITDTYPIKLDSIKAFSSQFYNPSNQEPSTYISSPTFLSYIEGRAIEMGHQIGVKYGEGFISSSPIGIEDVTELL